jgi:hypothetical protein
MSHRCPFYHDNSDGPNKTPPCKFEQNPYREHISYCKVCGQHRDLRFVGFRPNLLLILMVISTIIFLLNQGNPNNYPNNPPRTKVEKIGK